MGRLSILIAPFVLARVATAQTTFESTLDSIVFGNSIEITPDGNYVLGGDPLYYEAAALLICNNDGQLLWGRSYPVEHAQYTSVIPVVQGDGGYALTTIYGDSMALLRIDTDGDLIWSRSLNGGTLGDGFSTGAGYLIEAAAGGFVVVGNRFTPANHTDAYVVRIAANGSLLWTRTIGTVAGFDGASSVAQMDDGGFVIAGSGGYPGGSALLFRMDATGDTLWTRTYSALSAKCVRRTTDGGLIIAGETGTSAYLMKTDEDGTVIWSHNYSGPSSSTVKGRVVSNTIDGGYILSGEFRESGVGNDWDAFLIRTNANGDTLWTRTYGGSNRELNHSVVEAPDGGFLFFGDTQSFLNSGGWNSGFLVKTDVSGNVGCNIEPLSFVVEDGPTLNTHGVLDVGSVGASHIISALSNSHGSILPLCISTNTPEPSVEKPFRVAVDIATRSVVLDFSQSFSHATFSIVNPSGQEFYRREGFFAQASTSKTLNLPLSSGLRAIAS